MTERTPVTDFGDIWLGGMAFRLAQNPTVELGNIAQRPVNQGAPGPNDHPNYTTSIQEDWSGGALVRTMNPASDTGRFWWSTLETQYPRALALPPAAEEFTHPTGGSATPVVVGDFRDRMHVAWGDELYRYDANLGTWTHLPDMPGTPTRDGVVFREQSDTSSHLLAIFIPTTAGYVVLDEEDTFHDSDTITWNMPVRDFAVWDNKIFALTVSGELYWANKIPTALEEWTLLTTIPDESIPRRLVTYLDRSDNPVLMIVTDGSVFKVDFANSMLHVDDLDWPRHPFHGLAAAKYNGEFFASAGMGVWRYDNNTISAMGLDSRDGIPQQYRGYVVDLEPTQNGLYALIRGVSSDETAVQTYTLDLGQSSGQAYFDVGSTYNLLMIWNGFGWHYRWQGAGVPPTNIVVGNAQGTYGVWWGANGKLYRQTMSLTYFNPSTYSSSDVPLAASGSHETSWNDYNWVDQDKIMKAAELKVLRMPVGGYVDAFYKVDDDSNPWVPLGRIEDAGEYRWWLGQDIDEPFLREKEPFRIPNPHVKGVRHHRYKLRFDLARGENAYETPVIEWHAVVARRWLRPQRYWTVTLNLFQKSKDEPVEEQFNHLMQLAIDQEAFVMEHLDNQHMVEIMTMRFPESSGRDERRQVQLSLLESMELDRIGEHSTQAVQGE